MSEKTIDAICAAVDGLDRNEAIVVVAVIQEALTKQLESGLFSTPQTVLSDLARASALHFGDDIERAQRMAKVLVFVWGSLCTMPTTTGAIALTRLLAEHQWRTGFAGREPLFSPKCPVCNRANLGAVYRVDGRFLLWTAPRHLKRVRADARAFVKVRVPSEPRVIPLDETSGEVVLLCDQHNGEVSLSVGDLVRQANRRLSRSNKSAR